MDHTPIPIIREKQQLRDYLDSLRQAGKSIGFVPTMGALHQGHASLIHKAAKENESVVVSIFVNPLQFAPNEDFEQYPRRLEEDLALVQQAGGSCIFQPEAKRFYPPGFQSYVEVKELTQKLCGSQRPEHFRGVTTVVTKLFHLVEPDKAYFGQKDFQQALVIRKMVEDLDMPIAIRLCPIIREADGLALSSRNVYLSESQRKSALCLYRCLKHAQECFEKGESNPENLRQTLIQILDGYDGVELRYLEVLCAETLQAISKLEKGSLVALSVQIGSVFLIDNTLLGTEKI